MGRYRTTSLPRYPSASGPGRIRKVTRPRRRYTPGGGVRRLQAGVGYGESDALTEMLVPTVRQRNGDIGVRPAEKRESGWRRTRKTSAGSARRSRSAGRPAGWRVTSVRGDQRTADASIPSAPGGVAVPCPPAARRSGSCPDLLPRPLPRSAPAVEPASEASSPEAHRSLFRPKGGSADRGYLGPRPVEKKWGPSSPSWPAQSAESCPTVSPTRPPTLGAGDRCSRNAVGTAAPTSAGPEQAVRKPGGRTPPSPPEQQSPPRPLPPAKGKRQRRNPAWTIGQAPYRHAEPGRSPLRTCIRSPTAGAAADSDDAALRSPRLPYSHLTPARDRRQDRQGDLTA